MFRSLTLYLSTAIALCLFTAHRAPVPYPPFRSRFHLYAVWVQFEWVGGRVSLCVCGTAFSLDFFFYIYNIRVYFPCPTRFMSIDVRNSLFRWQSFVICSFVLPFVLKASKQQQQQQQKTIYFSTLFCNVTAISSLYVRKKKRTISTSWKYWTAIHLHTHTYYNNTHTWNENNTMLAIFRG